MILYMKRMHVSPESVDNPNRDRFILSKGHCVEAYLAVLAAVGFIDKKDVLETYCKVGSKYIGHPNNKVPGIEMNSGSLGHGLPVAVGMALAAKMKHMDFRTYVVMGDGELAEGSVWEALMAANQYHLDNLCAVVDRNYLQISGCTEDIMALENLHDRFTSFGWNVIEVENGNSLAALDAAFEQAEAFKGRPSVLIAHTVKGYGSSIMENKASWHHHIPSPEEYAVIVNDLMRKKEELL